jgi:hypothetical protein
MSHVVRVDLTRMAEKVSQYKPEGRRNWEGSDLDGWKGMICGNWKRRG